MSPTTSPARVTACSAARTKDRSAGRRRSSEVWLRNTRRPVTRLSIAASAGAWHRSSLVSESRESGTARGGRRTSRVTSQAVRGDAVGEDAARDFFISYTAVNEPWAKSIAVTLEGAGFMTLLQAFDFRPGSDFVQLMHEAT